MGPRAQPTRAHRFGLKSRTRQLVLFLALVLTPLTAQALNCSLGISGIARYLRDGASDTRNYNPKTYVPVDMASLDKGDLKKIFDMIVAAYAKIGGSPYSAPEELATDLSFGGIVVDDKAEIVAFYGGKQSPFGKKIVIYAGQGGHEHASQYVKSAVVGTGLDTLPALDHTFVELSGAPLHFASKASQVPVVPYSQVEKILAGKDIRPATDEDI